MIIKHKDFQAKVKFMELGADNKMALIYIWQAFSGKLNRRFSRIPPEDQREASLFLNGI